jgi:Domain of unknown function (DUF222)
MDPFTARERVVAALDAVDAAQEVLRSTCTDGVGAEFRVHLAVRLESQERVNRGLSYRVVGEIVDPRDELPERGVRARLAGRLRVSRGEIARRVKVAARIGPRRSVTGAPLAPLLPHLAQAVAAGLVGQDHIEAVCKALDGLPASVPVDRVARAEEVLVAHACVQDSAFVAELGRGIADRLNPDGLFDERDRAARRGLTLSRQGVDGMSRLSGWLTPAARAYFEAIAAAVRPGHHLPGSEQTVVDAATDGRSAGQRLHDAFEWGMRTALESGSLGQHRGIAVTVIATTTVQHLEQAAKALVDPSVAMPPAARTGGGSRLPMRDLIAMAGAGSMHYLAVFDDHSERPLYLGRTKHRLATADQRMICYARDHGCTRPGCTVAGYDCEVHHAPAGWALTHTGNADELFFACPPDNQAEADGYYSTTVTAQGRLGWTDGTGPPQVNRIHHPDELLGDDP